jgi:DNA polymerase-4
MGISTIYTLRSIPAELLERLMGKNGIEIWKRANGIDTTPVIGYSQQKSISTEHTLEKDTTDTEMLKQLLISMVEKNAYELREQEKLTSV